ncbi:MAG: asparaginase [Anaerolineae bacterium]|nr:asparaginase [Anaerolineae bacterium]
MSTPHYAPLVELTRGPLVESIHYGAAVLVDSNGRTIFEVGDPQTIVYLRSSSKPIQVLPFVEAGGIEKYKLSPKEVALMCSSHAGMDEHVKTVEGIQAKVGFSEKDLMCGVHPPMHRDTMIRMEANHERYTPNRHMCSGKHSGFLAYATLRNESYKDYLNPEHAIQKSIRDTFAEMCDYPAEKVAIGIDGCSAPVFGVPLYNAAYAFARFCDPINLSLQRAAACHKIMQAMMEYPEMVAGGGRFDTRLMETARGKLIAKCGAEGYQVVAIPAGVISAGSPGMALTIKVSDGDAVDRVAPLISVYILAQLGILNDKEAELLADYNRRPLFNWRKLPIGEIRPAFEFKRLD